MAKVRFLTVLYVILILVTQAISKQTFLYHFCQYDKGNYTTNSTYQTNLNHLMSTLPSQDGNGNGYGFYNLSYGNSSDKVYAMALCRGDANPEVCRSCLNESTQVLTQLCPNQKGAVGWYDNCMLRYSNRSMFGVMDTSRKFFMWNTQNVSDTELFLGDVWTLLSDLKNRAATGGSLSKYATGKASAPDNQTMYALVQCTPDLSQQECGSCLDEATGNLGRCCEGKIGGRVVGPSCNFRYEEYLFYGSTYDPLPAFPPTQSPVRGKDSNTSRTVIIIAVVTSTVVSTLLIIFVCLYLRKRRAKKIVQTRPLYKPVEEFGGAESLQYSLDTIRIATDDFSEANKLGQGGFGSVYKGRFSDGQEIAVKRLSRDAGQGDLQFKNEVLLVAKLHHRNLVRLLGFCSERNEKILVYEFVPNTSLDHFIFDPIKRTTLDWDKRYKIIRGVARGLLYLHQDSQLRIIHRDLKTNNILLDEKMDPKISDFGMARLFVVDQTQGNTSQIVGTYGYMAPEYAINGQFSVKSDVYSLGVLFLEIVSGQKTNCFSNGEHADQDLLSYAWTSWREGNVSNIIDPLLRLGSRSEIMRCIHIALLCVQENIADRPTMSRVVLMLGSDSLSLPLPSEPGFYIRNNNTMSDISLVSDHSNSRVINESDHSNIESAQESANEAFNH